MQLKLQLLRVVCLVFLMLCVGKVELIAQDVEPGIVKLQNLAYDTVVHRFSSYATPFINGPTETAFGDHIFLRHLGGYDYELVYVGGSSILPQGWNSHYQFTPDSISDEYSVQRVRMYVQESILSLEGDFFRVPTDSTVLLDPLVNDRSTDGPLRLNTVTISNYATASVVDSLNRIEFRADSGFVGMARVQYVACDTLDHCAVANISVYVRNPQDSVARDTLMATSVNARSIQTPLPYSGFVYSMIPANGESYIDSADILHYIADEGFVGKDTLTVWDSLDYYYTLIVEAIDVEQENGFVIQDVFYLRPNNTFQFDVYANDFYNTLSLDSFTQVDTGLLVHDSLGYFTYTPPDEFVGYTKFNYTVCNGSVCETTSVYLFVGKQEPRSDIDNHFTTPQHLPVIIDFDNDLDDSSWTMEIVEQARYGEAAFPLYYFDPCVTFNILTDYLIYEPGSHLGEDTFSIRYCLTETASCDTIDIYITVEEDPDASCSCTERCVWPGDANNDGVVEISDLLEIGLRIGDLGTRRSAELPTAWEAQYASNWDLLDEYPIDAKYIDTDGDGVISAMDTVALVDNYKKQHALVANRDYLMETIPVEMSEVEGPLDSGDLVVLDVFLGNHDVPALDVHGMSFSLEYDSELVDSSTARVDFLDYAWIIGDAPKFELDVSIADGLIDAGVTRLDKAVASGYGIVAQFSFIIIDDVEGIRLGEKTRIPLDITMKNITLKSSNGTNRYLPDVKRTIYIYRGPQNVALSEDQLFVFPNPALDYVTVHLNGQNAMTEYQFFDMSGRLQQSGQLSGKRDRINVSGLEGGIYALRILTERGPLVKKVVIKN